MASEPVHGIDRALVRRAMSRVGGPQDSAEVIGSARLVVVSWIDVRQPFAEAIAHPFLEGCRRVF